MAMRYRMTMSEIAFSTRNGIDPETVQPILPAEEGEWEMVGTQLVEAIPYSGEKMKYHLLFFWRG